MSQVNKIYVSGHRGMVGSAIVRALQQQGQANFGTRMVSAIRESEQAGLRSGGFDRKLDPNQTCASVWKVLFFYNPALR